MINQNQRIAELIATLKAEALLKGKRSKARTIDKIIIIEQLSEALHNQFKGYGLLTITRSNINASLEEFPTRTRQRIANSVLTYLLSKGLITQTEHIKNYSYTYYRHERKINDIKNRLSQFKKGQISKEQYIKRGLNTGLNGQYRTYTHAKRLIISYKLNDIMP